MRALLLDLYDTIAELDLVVVSSRLCDGLGVEVEPLFAGIVATAAARSTGAYGSYAGDLGAIATACGRSLGSARLSELAREMTQLSEQTVRLYEEVLPALQGLRGRGVKLAVVSNCDHVTREVVGALGLSALVDAIVLSCDVMLRKPDARIFLHALERLEVSASQAVFVDDQASYLDAAAALGMRTFHMLRGDEAQAAATSRHPVVGGLDELCALLA